MASLIRSGAGIPGTLQASGQLSTVSSSHSAGATQTASVTQSPLGHTFPTHLPRGEFFPFCTLPQVALCFSM